MEIAVQENSKLITQADLAFLVRAVNEQMEKHWAPAFEDEPWPTNAYANLQGLTPGTFWPMAILDDIQEPGALGYHTEIAGLVFGRVTASKDPNDGSTLSHECLEMRGDPGVDLWIPMPDGRSIALEMCDPCEQDVYAIAVTIGAETRSIMVSDFVLPAYFVADAPPPYSYLGTIDEPFGLSRNGGGYRVIKDANGNVSSDFGRFAPDTAKMTRKLANPLSRSVRRGLPLVVAPELRPIPPSRALFIRNRPWRAK